MAKTNHAQYAFSAGELSPRMEMRDDVDARAMGMDLLLNWFIHLQGSIETSPGFEYKADSPGAYGRVFPFYVSTYSGFIVLVTPEYVFVTDQNGFVTHDDEVINGDFLDGGDGWTVLAVSPGAVSFAGGACILTPGGGVSHSAAVRQDMTVIATEPHRLVIQIAAGTGPVLVTLGSTTGGSDIYTGVHSGTAAITLIGRISPTAVMSLTILDEGGEPAKIIDKISCYNTSVEPEPIVFDSPWTTQDQIAGIQTEIAPGSLDMFMSSTIETQILSYDQDTRDWDFSPADFTNTPEEWVAGNWPVALTYHQGRLYLGGTNKQPEDWWCTRPGRLAADPEAEPPVLGWEKYRDWQLADEDGEILPDHAIQFTIEKRGRIRWMRSAHNLVVGTENAEHIITAQDGVIMPGDVQSTLQSTYGSVPAMAVEVGNSILFVTPDGRKIRSMGYDANQREAWVAKDLTFMAEHITDNGNRIAQLHYSANPFSIIYGVTTLGNAVGCTYDPESQVGGFFRRTTQGPIISSCVLPYGGRDEVWALIDRDFEGPDLSLEKSHGDENIKLDSFIILSSLTPTMAWSAPHLGGFVCQALVDGAVHPDITVEADGSFETQFDAIDVIIGIQIISSATTMSLGTAVQYVGTARPMKKRWNKLYARIVGSWKPKLNGRRPPTRHPATPMGTMEPPRTETVQVANLGWDLDGRVNIEQDLPVATEIAGIFGELNQEQL